LYAASKGFREVLRKEYREAVEATIGTHGALITDVYERV
jgi:hypothetical protein